eukprot:2032531-Rhodomonas_salina.1
MAVEDSGDVTPPLAILCRGVEWSGGGVRNKETKRQRDRERQEDRETGTRRRVHARALRSNREGDEESKTDADGTDPSASEGELTRIWRYAGEATAEGSAEGKRAPAEAAAQAAADAGTRPSCQQGRLACSELGTRAESQCAVLSSSRPPRLRVACVVLTACVARTHTHAITPPLPSTHRARKRAWIRASTLSSAWLRWRPGRKRSVYANCLPQTASGFAIGVCRSILAACLRNIVCAI